MTALGVTLIVAALVLLLAEAHLSTGGLIASGAGVATVGGITALLLAAGAGTIVVLAVALCAAAAAGTGVVLLRQRLERSLRARPRTGREALVGHTGVVRSVAGSELEVYLEGALWRAEPEYMHDTSELHDGDRVVVDRVNGLTLHVHRAEEWELNP